MRIQLKQILQSGPSNSVHNHCFFSDHGSASVGVFKKGHLAADLTWSNPSDCHAKTIPYLRPAIHDHENHLGLLPLLDQRSTPV